MPSAVDDRYRLVHRAVHDNETAVTATGFWLRACAFFAPTASTSAKYSPTTASLTAPTPGSSLTASGITVRYAHPYRPQTNGKVERFHRTLRNECAYGKAYRTEHILRKASTRWLHTYNHHRPHTALGGKPPITRVTNLPGQNF